ncbi:12944_t:CDS:2, partial [Gigaspora rosea]
LNKEHLIPIVNAEIEEIDMEHDLDNYMWFGAGDADCSDQERYDQGEIE